MIKFNRENEDILILWLKKMKIKLGEYIPMKKHSQLFVNFKITGIRFDEAEGGALSISVRRSDGEEIEDNYQGRDLLEIALGALLFSTDMEMTSDDEEMLKGDINNLDEETKDDILTDLLFWQDYGYINDYLLRYWMKKNEVRPGDLFKIKYDGSDHRFDEYMDKWWANKTWTFLSLKDARGVRFLTGWVYSTAQTAINTALVWNINRSHLRSMGINNIEYWLLGTFLFSDTVEKVEVVGRLNNLYKIEDDWAEELSEDDRIEIR